MPSYQNFDNNFKEDRNNNYKVEKLFNSVPHHKIKHPPLPEIVTFAGDTVPLSREDVLEDIEYELVVNTFRHSRTVTVIKRLKRWRPMIENILQEHNIPSDFIYLAVAESELDNTARSYANAMGMWQFMKSTARQYGLKMNYYVDMRRDPKKSTEAACKYFNWAYSKFHDWFLVAASYNRGVRGIKNKLKEQNVDNFFDLYLNKQTARYVYRIIAFKLILENPEKYGFHINHKIKYNPYEFKKVKVDHSIDLIDFAEKYNTTYKKLRILNPWFNNSNTYQLKVPWHHSYSIRIPVDKEIDPVESFEPCNYVNHFYQVKLNKQ